MGHVPCNLGIAALGLCGSPTSSRPVSKASTAGVVLGSGGDLTVGIIVAEYRLQLKSGPFSKWGQKCSTPASCVL